MNSAGPRSLRGWSTCCSRSHVTLTTRERLRGGGFLHAGEARLADTACSSQALPEGHAGLPRALARRRQAARPRFPRLASGIHQRMNAGVGNSSREQDGYLCGGTLRLRRAAPVPSTSARARPAATPRRVVRPEAQAGASARVRRPTRRIPAAKAGIASSSTARAPARRQRSSGSIRLPAGDR